MQGGDSWKHAIGPHTTPRMKLVSRRAQTSGARAHGRSPLPWLSPQQAKFALYRCARQLRWRLPHTLFCTLAWERGLSARHFLWTCLVRGLGRRDRLPLAEGGGGAGDAGARLSQVWPQGRQGRGRAGSTVPPPQRCPLAR